MELPIELISYIMKFLSSSDRHEASLVCKKWYHASLDPGLHLTSVITLRASTATGEKFHDLGQRKSPSLVVSHIDGSSTCSQVLQEIGNHLGPHLTSLSLRGSEVNENVFIAIISYCTGLQKLDLSCCNSLFMSGNLLLKEEHRRAAKPLENITSLNLGTNRYLSDILFNRLVSVMPNITKLSLASCNIIHQSGAYFSEDKKSSSFLSLSNFLRFLQCHSAKVVALNLSYTGMGSESLRLISRVKGLFLEELILKKCNGISNDGVIHLVKEQTSLKTLDLSGVQSLNSPSLEAISSHLPHLEHLNVSDWSQLEPQASEYLSKMKRLKSISLSGCYNIGLHFLRKGFGSGGNSSNLVSLSLGGCGSVHDEDVLSMVKSLPELEQLDLSSCFGVGDSSVHAIARFLPKLKKLRLAWCKKITDFGLLGLDQEAPVFITESDSPKHYSDRFTKSHSNMGFFKLPSFNEKILAIPEKEILQQMEAPDQVNLTALKKLESLDLMACNHLTDVCIAHTIRFPHLRSLNLSLCSNITDNGLTAVATNNPQLTELLIGQCHQVSDVGLKALITQRKGLQSLDICGCGKVTDSALAELGTHTKHLKHLNVSQCNKVTMAMAQKLQFQLPGLRSLQTAHISSGGSAFYHYQPINF